MEIYFGSPLSTAYTLCRSRINLLPLLIQEFKTAIFMFLLVGPPRIYTLFLIPLLYILLVLTCLIAYAVILIWRIIYVWLVNGLDHLSNLLRWQCACHQLINMLIHESMFSTIFVSNVCSPSSICSFTCAYVHPFNFCIFTCVTSSIRLSILECLYVYASMLHPFVHSHVWLLSMYTIWHSLCFGAYAVIFSSVNMYISKLIMMIHYLTLCLCRNTWEVCYWLADIFTLTEST